MRFGPRVREIRRPRKLTQRELAEELCVRFTYISQVENETLHFGDYPREKFILNADAAALLLLVDKASATIRQRPVAFHSLPSLDDLLLDGMPTSPYRWVLSNKSRLVVKVT